MSRRVLQSFFMALIVVIVGSAFAWVLLGRPATGIDDADIFFVYARHLAEGHGFVYNLGGERVEGFTSMLWTLICSGFFHLTHAIELPLRLFSLALGAATVWACLRRGRHQALFLVLLIAEPAWFAWCQVTLMETGLWCLVLTLLVLAVVERRSIMVSFLMPLLVLTRPESMLWGAWLILMLGWATVLRDGWRKAAKAIAVPCAVFACSLLALVAFRVKYFGYPFPNTYYAEVSPNLMYDLRNGAYYLFRYLFSNPAVLLVATTWLWLLVRGLRRLGKGSIAYRSPRSACFPVLEFRCL
jgi:arabinofuranosyltransferase